MAFQESGNKLMECSSCQNLYHQECHNPPVSNEKASDPRLIWNCDKCSNKYEKNAISVRKKIFLPFQKPLFSESRKIYLRSNILKNVFDFKVSSSEVKIWVKALEAWRMRKDRKRRSLNPAVVRIVEAVLTQDPANTSHHQQRWGSGLKKGDHMTIYYLFL